MSENTPGRSPEDIQEMGLKTLVESGSFKFTDTFFPYTSGQIGPYFVNSENVSGNAVTYRNALNLMDDRIRARLTPDELDRIDGISGGESRDWVFSYSIADRLKKAHLAIYKDGKTFGLPIKNKTFIHVADLNNEGSSPEKMWIPIIRKNNGGIRYIFFYVDRLEDGVEAMKRLHLDSNSVVPLNERAWNKLKEYGVVNEVIYGNLRARMEDKDVWARAMLRSEKGIERCWELAQDPKSSDKIKKVLKEGYPDMYDEIMCRLKEKFGSDEVISLMAGMKK